MADETDTTSEVARVLGEHYDGAIRMDAWVCSACGAALAMPSWNAMVEGTTGPLLRKAMAKHQADLLAEAGVLRGDGPKRIGRSPGTLYVGIGVTPHDWATRGETFDTWYEASPEQAIAALRGEANRWAAEYGLPQIAAPVPAGQPAAGSAGCGGSGGVGGAPAGSLGSQLRFASLVAASTEGARWIQELSREADRLENEAEMQGHSARTWRVQAEQALAQVEAIRGQIAYEARHGDAITRCNLVAERFQTVLNSVTNGEGA